MTRRQIEAALDAVFDQAILFHGFTDYVRDYEIITFSVADPSTGIEPAVQRYLFKHCVDASATTTLPAATWERSLGDELLEPVSDLLDSFHWGVRWQCLYPGAVLVPDSARALEWTRALGIDFHEADITTNAQRINLVFADLAVLPAEEGYAPFMAHLEG